MRRSLQPFIVLTIIVAVITLMQYIGWLRPVEFLLARSLTPVSQFLYGSRIQIYPDTTVRTFDEAIEAYSALRDKVSDLEAAVGEKEMIEQENELLRSQLGFVNSYGYEVLSADVIGRQIDPTESTIILNRGAQSGITKDMPVIVGGGILIGKITLVEQTRAIVRLLNDSQSNIAATINNEEVSVGVIEGGFGIAIQMNFIPQNERIQPGDRVLTSGLSETIPRGLYIGTIESVEKEAYQPFQRAIIRPAIQFDRVSTVSIITGRNKL